MQTQPAETGPILGKIVMENLVQSVQPTIETLYQFVLTWLSQPSTWIQFVAVLAVIAIAKYAGRRIADFISQKLNFDETSKPIIQFLGGLAKLCLPLIFPLVAFVLAHIVETIVAGALGTSVVVGLGKRLILVYLVSVAVKHVLQDPMLRILGKFIALPVAFLYAFGLFPFVHQFLADTQVPLGNLSFHLIDLVKMVGFGGVLFWLGSWTNARSATYINNQTELRQSTRQLAVKTSEIVIFGLAFFILLNLLEADLNKFVVLSGAIGVGLGFGLQKIASNFISGVILLLEGQATVGDYVELDGGEAGTIIKMLSRAVILESYDGRWIVVPNEDFIVTRVVNYSDSGSANRYEAPFSVSYDTNINLIPDIVEQAVATHPEVLDQPFPPDCELRAFGDSGIEFSVEFWVNGIDDGKNKFTSDVLFLIWNALQDNNIQMPFPQRVVHLKKIPDDV